MADTDIATTNAQRKSIRIGTRGSKLALVQAEIVRAALLDLHPEFEVTLETIATRGDVVQDLPLSQIGGNGVFVRKVEEALEAGLIDMAVHSAKDLPSTVAPGMTIAAYLPRADARDALVSRHGATLIDLPRGARVGTSSPRRTCQLRALRPDLELLDIRGNVDTRLRKLREGQYDAIVLAAAGLERLGELDNLTTRLDIEVMIPAVGQGALAVEVRSDDNAVIELAGQLNDPGTWTAVTAERAFLARVGGSCTLPVGAHARIKGSDLSIVGMVGVEDGRMVRGELKGFADDPARAGSELADDLLGRGGRDMVAVAKDEGHRTIDGHDS
jgi:hydroxymethylbilane synthase